ncbi:glycoside hydrolase family 5 protein [Sphingomonas sp. PB2P19]|uniref:glycoside hydrolase family 5 protein n=1 Tax=Sphingomonas rhamnosi TaxID=3096156 RepID=UPI002FC927A1
MPRPLLPIALVAGAFLAAGTSLWALASPAALMMTGQGAAQKARPAAPARPLRYTGLNLGAGGFASKQKPALYGKHYAYPNAREAAPFVAAGMNIVRVPVLWDRLQAQPMAPLDATEMQRIDASFAALSGFDRIILDVHNYARYQGVKIADPQSGAMLADLWTRLAERYGKDPRIVFGLMNEPHGIDAQAWRGVVDQVVKAIRATGARNLVLVPGVQWTGAYSWTAGGSRSNAAAFASFRDPGGNFAYELHQYADSNSSGTHNDCIDPAAAAHRLDSVTAWLETQHARAVLGEFGVAANPQCLAALEAMLGRMEQSPDAWLGWTYWAGGAWWGTYPFSIQPDANGAKPQMRVLMRHIAGRKRM